MPRFTPLRPLLLAAGVLAAPSVRAADAVVAPAGGGLAALSVRVDLAARTVDAGGTAVPITLDPAQLPAPSEVTAEVVPIGKDEHVVHVRVPAKGAGDDGPAWEAILAAGRPPIFADVTGAIHGDPGERTGKAVQILSNPSDAATKYVLVGNVSEDGGICGQRVTLLDPRALYPSLELRPATVQRLAPARQAAAVALGAIDKGAQPEPSLARLLVARGTTATELSADARGEELTDGNLATAWTEHRPGMGQGEFVTMAAPRDVPIARLQIAIVPTDPPGAGAAPRTLYVATAEETFRVVLPSDGWVKPGKTFEVTLPAPVQTSCLSLVLDTAYTRGLARPEVSVSELVAYSEFDGPGVTLEDVASKLSGPRGAAAAQVLERAGSGALPAVQKAYDALEERGRALAMDVAASHERCEDAVPLLTRGLCEPEGQAPRKAREKLGRCKEAAEGLAASLRGDAARRACVAPVLAQIAPEAALAPLAEALGGTPEEDHATRETLRVAFAGALQAAPPGRLGPLLADPRTPLGARLDVVRAAGPRVVQAPAESGAAIAQLLQGSPPMRARYLLLEPLAELARAGDKTAAARLADAVARDADWPVRARAAELGARVPEAASALGAAARDPEPRVREAALGALGQAPTAEGIQAAAAALGEDHWPFVRAQAVAVLAASGPSRVVDDALGGALEDRSPRVRGGAVLALGRRRAMSWRDRVRDRLEDRNEEGDVRAEAAWALGAMCDAGSLDRLTELARVLPAPDATEQARQIGLAALISLAAIKPGDLGKRIAPLLAKTAPPDVQRAAEKAMSAKGACR